MQVTQLRSISLLPAADPSQLRALTQYTMPQTGSGLEGDAYVLPFPCLHDAGFCRWGNIRCEAPESS